MEGAHCFSCENYVLIGIGPLTVCEDLVKDAMSSDRYERTTDALSPDHNNVRVRCIHMKSRS